MNIKEIKALAQILESAGLTSIEYTEGETKIRLEKTTNTVQSTVAAPSAAQLISAAQVSSAAVHMADVEVDSGVAAVEPSNLKEVKSPMVGVFYAASAPDAEPFVSLGTKVKKGDVVCIIEAMKLMNDIIAEADGEIVEICAKSGEVVEFGQCLFRMR